MVVSGAIKKIKCYLPGFVEDENVYFLLEKAEIALLALNKQEW